MRKFVIVILILSIAFAYILLGGKLFLVLTHPIKFENYINFYAEKTNLSPSLIASLINVESGYKTNAKSNKNALGLMQIKLETAIYVAGLNGLTLPTETDLYVPETNIQFGTLYFEYLQTKFEDIITCLCAYNAGETRVRSWLKNTNYSLDGKILNTIPFSETKNYVNKVLSNQKFYQKVYI
ncbi:MAG: lytic transglycosylase domain-containing protein [Clostridia bacterium]|nr:lytic transglycosylase domain-containing protein [Clostridia bacterium]